MSREIASEKVSLEIFAYFVRYRTEEKKAQL
jgi:hypothetical protein